MRSSLCCRHRPRLVSDYPATSPRGELASSSFIYKPVEGPGAVKAAFAQNAIILGYDVHGKPWFWPDATRVMQSVIFGATGSGKTTLLKNIITQDFFRVLGPPEDRHRVPMLIFDGKGDQDFLSDLLPAVEPRAGCTN